MILINIVILIIFNIGVDIYDLDNHFYIEDGYPRDLENHRELDDDLTDLDDDSHALVNQHDHDWQSTTQAQIPGDDTPHSWKSDRGFSRRMFHASPITCDNKFQSVLEPRR